MLCAPYDWANGDSADVFCARLCEMSAEFHYRNLILGIQCFRLIT